MIKLMLKFLFYLDSDSCHWHGMQLLVLKLEGSRGCCEQNFPSAITHLLIFIPPYSVMKKRWEFNGETNEDPRCPPKTDHDGRTQVNEGRRGLTRDDEYVQRDDGGPRYVIFVLIHSFTDIHMIIQVILATIRVMPHHRPRDANDDPR